MSDSELLLTLLLFLGSVPAPPPLALPQLQVLLRTVFPSPLPQHRGPRAVPRGRCQMEFRLHLRARPHPPQRTRAAASAAAAAAVALPSAARGRPLRAAPGDRFLERAHLDRVHVRVDARLAPHPHLRHLEGRPDRGDHPPGRPAVDRQSRRRRALHQRQRRPGPSVDYPDAEPAELLVRIPWRSIRAVLIFCPIFCPIFFHFYFNPLPPPPPPSSSSYGGIMSWSCLEGFFFLKHLLYVAFTIT